MINNTDSNAAYGEWNYTYSTKTNNTFWKNQENHLDDLGNFENYG